MNLSKITEAKARASYSCINVGSLYKCRAIEFKAMHLCGIRKKKTSLIIICIFANFVFHYCLDVIS